MRTVFTLRKPSFRLRNFELRAPLFAKRPDIRGDISRLVSAQRKIRHLGVGVEKEEGHLFRGEIRLTRDCRKRRNVRARLFLIACHDVARGAPAFRQLAAFVCIGSPRCRCRQSYHDGDKNVQFRYRCPHQGAVHFAGDQSIRNERQK
jgi:hypothetical protein